MGRYLILVQYKRKEIFYYQRGIIISLLKSFFQIGEEYPRLLYLLPVERRGFSYLNACQR